LNSALFITGKQPLTFSTMSPYTCRKLKPADKKNNVFFGKLWNSFRFHFAPLHDRYLLICPKKTGGVEKWKIF